MTTTAATTPRQYRVVAMMIQITGHPRTGASNVSLERTFRQGDTLPGWVNDEDLKRLSTEGWIEALS